MKVIAEEPWGWFLFEDDSRLYLDVLVEHGVASFFVTVELSAEQVADYAREDVTSIARLASDMRHKALTREWKVPALPPGWSDRSLIAVREWRKQHAI